MPATRLLVGSFNPGKVAEVRAALAAAGIGLPVMALKEVQGAPIYVEKGATFEENAVGKVLHYSRYGRDLTLTDDSGLCVDALGGEPGVRSARYGTVEKVEDAVRYRYLLDALRDVPDDRRGASFYCVLALGRWGRLVKTFTGECRGRILREPRGEGGFGYDPVFQHEATGCTFAEMTTQEKQRVSHRGAALAQLADYLKGLESPLTGKTITLPRAD
ncbi:MAG TPA: RdgB/HAM1 family non-canonical purine NTP pyrophosphatase [Candidatus Polarisedimenticolia bacterium]|nr:RdgB/HAM1 family non-canonical purine NTP pyrophosphatase [Candidatus Polarisedimenticolia bacterium]